MRFKIKNLLKQEFVKNLATMVSGNAVAQAIPMLAGFFLARLYTPDEIGAYSFFFTFVNSVSVIATLRYDSAIVLAKSDKEGQVVFFLSIILSLSLSLIIFLFIFFFKSWIILNLDYPILVRYIYLFPISVFLLALISIFNFINNRYKEYKTIVLAKVTQNVVMCVCQITTYTFSAFGLILGYILGLLSAIIQTYKCSSNLNFKGFEVRQLKAVMSKYKDFAIFYTPISFINKLSYGLPIILFPIYFDMSMVGHYSYSALLVLGPMGVLTSSMQQVFYQKISEMNTDGEELRDYLIKTYKSLFALGLIPHLLLLLFAPFIFSLVLGEQWRPSGEFTRYLMPWFFMVFMNSSVSSIYVIKNKQRQYLFLESVVLFLRFVAIFAGFYFFKSGQISVLFFGVVGFVYELIVMRYFLYISKNFN